MASYKKVYKDMQKKANQPKITSLFMKSSVSPFHHALLDHLIIVRVFRQER